MDIKIKRTMDYDVKCYPGVKIKLKYLTMEETEDVREFIPAVGDTPNRFAYDPIKTLKYAVLEIENLTIIEDGKKTEIKNGVDIADNPGLNELYMELFPVLIKMDARVDAKN